MSYRDPTIPGSWAPIALRQAQDGRTPFDGESILVRGGKTVALVRWVGADGVEGGWFYPASGIALDFEPDSYLLREGV